MDTQWSQATPRMNKVNLQTTKIDCLVQRVFKEVIAFPDYKINIYYGYF